MFYFLFFAQYKNEQKERKFWRQKNKKGGFYKNKNVAKINDIDVSILIPYSAENSFKYFIKYNDNDVIRLLCIKLPQMTGYVRKYEGNATMVFKISYKQLLKKYNKYGKEFKNY